MSHIYLSPESRPRGHGKYAGYDVFEQDVCDEIAQLLSRRLTKAGFKVTIGAKGTNMASRVAFANAHNVDYYMCIHSNAGGGTGAECLYYNAPASIRANQLVYDELIKLYPSKRGIKDYSHFYENAYTQMVSCYPEIAFHDNIKDAKFIVENKPAIAEALFKGICAYFGIEPQPEPESQKLHYVQIGAYAEKANAEKAVKQAIDKGFKAFIKEE